MVFEFIKIKIYIMSINAYSSISKMIQNLENIFAKFDKIAKSDTLLHNPKFSIVVLNPKKTFNKFLA